MGHDDDGRAELIIDGQQHLNHAIPSLGVELARRFIKQQQLRSDADTSCDDDPQLLAAGHGRNRLAGEAAHGLGHGIGCQIGCQNEAGSDQTRALAFKIWHPRENWSGRADLNRRPHGPEPCTLTGLSYFPRAPSIPTG